MGRHINSPVTQETRNKISQTLKKRLTLLDKKRLYEIGKNTWINNKGKKFSSLHKKRMSETRKKLIEKGIKVCGFTIGLCGKDNPNWRGGVTKLNQSIRMSARYKIWRLEVLKRDNYTCQICIKRGGKLEVDHIKPFALFPELRFELSNGRTLCVDCHKDTPTYKGKSKKLSNYQGLNI